MKFNKKIIVPALSTVMGLSLVGGIAGTFAWYQYSTQATASLIGTNVAETGVLEISATSATDGFKRDLISADILGQTHRQHSKITPVTFGKVNNGEALPAQAYKNPNAALNKDAANPGSYANVYELASAAEDYIQYNIWIRAREVGNVADGFSRVAKDVFLSDIVLEDTNHYIDEGLRVHLAVDEDNNGTPEKNFLFAKSVVNGLQLYGVLDCDNDGRADIVGGYEWKANRNDLVYYGNEGDYQNAIAMADLKASKDVDGNIDAYDNANIDKRILTTPTAADSAAKVTVTIWLEGWDNRVDSDSIGLLTTENVYIRDDSMKAEDLTGRGLYTKPSATTYAVASGLAVTGTEYYAVAYEKVHFDEGEFLEGSKYRATADATAAFVAAHTVAAGGEDVYEVHEKDVSGSIRYALADTSSYYTEAAGVYTAASGEADSAETYYSLLAEATGTVSVEDSVASGSVSVEGLYTRADNPAGGYIFTAAHGKNVNGTAYYALADAAINVPMWSGENTDGVEFHFGLTFDVGQDAFKA